MGGWHDLKDRGKKGCPAASLPERLFGLMRKGGCSQVLCYVFWGGMAFLVNIASYWLLLWAGMDYKAANLISMLLTKTTAYLSNKFFVFRSRCGSWRGLVQEILMFAAARGLSGVVEYVGLICLVDFLHWEKLAGKMAMVGIVTVLNYFFGKHFVYKNK